MLTQVEIRTLLDCLAQEPVVEPSDGFPYTVTRKVSGYSDKHGALQAKLSVMLEVAARAGR